MPDNQTSPSPVAKLAGGQVIPTRTDPSDFPAAELLAALEGKAREIDRRKLIDLLAKRADIEPGKLAKFIESGGESQAGSVRTIAFAREHYIFLRDQNGDVLARRKSGANVALPIGRENSSFEQELCGAYFASTDGEYVASTNNVIKTISGLAMAEPRQFIPARLGWHKTDADPKYGDLIIDLGDDEGRFIRIRNGEWSVPTTEQSPMTFRRTAQTGAMPVPVAKGKHKHLAEQIRELSPSIDPDDRHMVACYLISLLIPRLKYPALIITGEKTAGKSEAMKRIKSLIDPAPEGEQPEAELVKEEDIAVTARAQHVIMVDNAGGMPKRISNFLCRLVTGGGFTKRKQYSDSEAVTISFQNPLIINGIDPPTEDDFASRSILLRLRFPKDKESHRVNDDELRVKWEAIRPAMLAALLTDAAQVIERWKTVATANYMTDDPKITRLRGDFPRVAFAYDQAMGLTGEKSVLNRYADAIDESLAHSAEGNPAFQLITTFLIEAASKRFTPLAPRNGGDPNNPEFSAERRLITWSCEPDEGYEQLRNFQESSRLRTGKFRFGQSGECTKKFKTIDPASGLTFEHSDQQGRKGNRAKGGSRRRWTFYLDLDVYGSPIDDD